MEQPTKSDDRVVRIAGTFTGSQDYEESDGHWVWSWSGNATFGPPNTNNPGANGTYPIASGTASYEAAFTANGPGQFGGCSAHGSETVNLTDPGWEGSWQALGTGNDGLSPPYQYSGTIAGASNGTAGMVVTLSSCPNPSDNGKTADTARPDPARRLRRRREQLSHVSGRSVLYRHLRPLCQCRTGRVALGLPRRDGVATP